MIGLEDTGGSARPAETGTRTRIWHAPGIDVLLTVHAEHPAMARMLSRACGAAVMAAVLRTANVRLEEV